MAGWCFPVYAGLMDKNFNPDKDILERIKDRGRRDRKRVLRKRRTVPLLTCLLLVIGACGLFIYIKAGKTFTEEGFAVAAPEEVHDDVVIRLASGEKILLSETAGSDVIADNHGVQIITDREQDGGAPATGNGEGYKRKVVPRIEEVAVPSGGFVKMDLEDGSHVYLNSSSTLVFPEYFVGDKREVYLIGEAFFEVSRNEHMPLIVVTDKMTVEVKGTSFNVSAYPDESSTVTTLVTGSVVVQTGNNITIGLLPGEQVSVSGNQIEKKKVDTDFYTSWINGKVFFENAPLSEICRQVSRWYGYDFDFVSQSASDMRFTGSIFRHDPIEYFIGNVELTSTLKFIKKDSGYLIKEE